MKIWLTVGNDMQAVQSYVNAEKDIWKEYFLFIFLSLSLYLSIFLSISICLFIYLYIHGRTKNIDEISS